LHLVGILFPHINDDARSKSHQTVLDQFTRGPDDESKESKHVVQKW